MQFHLDQPAITGQNHKNLQQQFRGVLLMQRLLSLDVVQKNKKLMLKALQRWMPWPQEPIFLHLLEPETGLGVASKNTNNVFFSKGLYVEQNTQH